MNSHDPDVDNPFVAMWRNGYRSILPILPPKAKLSHTSEIPPEKLGKNPGKLTPNGWIGLHDWQHHVTQESELRVWHRSGAGIGLRADNGILGIDTDPVNKGDAETIQRIVREMLGDLPKRIGQAPKAMYVCRTDPDFRHPKLMFRDGQVDLFTRPRQFVVHGAHPGTLRPYEWPVRLVPFDKLPLIAPETIEAFMARLLEELPEAKMAGLKVAGPAEPTPPQESLRGAPALIAEAMSHIPNDYVDREPYIEMAAALKGSLPDNPDLAWNLFWKWCEGWERGEDVNEESVARKDFDSLHAPFRLGVDYVCKLAELRSDGVFKAAERWVEEIKDEPPPRPKTGGINPTVYRFPEPSSIAPRESLYGGHYVREWVSSTIAPSKVGKSTLVLAEALAMASGKPLLGVQPAGVFRVWWWNGEDPIDELERRVAAAMQFYGLTREDLGNSRIMVDSGRDMPINLAIQERSGAKIVAATERELIQAIQNNGIDVTIFDPFISLHKVSENDNNAIDIVAKKCNDIAGATHSAIELAHHTRKLYGNGATVEDGRGASALLATTRSTRALAKMTKAEAREYGLGAEYKTLFHFTDASSNIFAADPDMEEKWLRLESVNLGNGKGDGVDKFIGGDQVGVARQFDLKAARRDVLGAANVGAAAGDEGVAREERALAAVRRQECRKDTRSDAWVGVPIAQALGIDRDTEEGLSQVKSIIKEWLKAGKLTEENRPNKARQIKTYVIAPLTTVAGHSAEPEKGFFE